MLFPLLAATEVLSGWQLFLQQCVNGLTFGALIALMALGYTMVYGIIGLINFAHGDLFMLGAMLTLSLDRAGSGWIPQTHRAGGRCWALP